MSYKGKKMKKKPKSGHEGRSKEVLTSNKIHAYFTNEEITKVKSILKTKDLAVIPFAVAATVLHKLDLLKRLLDDGYSINQTGQNNITALTWAVKHKFLDVVEFLLDNGGDSTIKTEGGDNILIIALEHKLWDEQSFLALWTWIKKISSIDINYTSKNGHHMLHMCVRRDWEEVLAILLSEKPNVDAGNANGVTPLMLACFRNNINIIEALISSGADILIEDNHGRMTLCYAITTAMKLPNPLNVVTQKILEELRKRSSLEIYLKRRLDLVILAGRKSEISCSTSDMLIKIVQFAVQFTEGGLEILLESKIFTQLAEVITTCSRPEIAHFLLEITNGVLFYNDNCNGFSAELQERVTEDFSKSGLVKFCCETLQRNDSELSKKVLKTLILSYSEKWSDLFRENAKNLRSHIQSGNFADDVQTLTQTKILQKKLAQVKNFLNTFDLTKTVPENKKKPDTLSSKKSKRRSKAIKAKLTKIKSAELTKRLNLAGKKILQPKNSKISPKATATIPVETFEKQNPIASSLQNFLEKAGRTTRKRGENRENDPKWKKLVLDLPFIDFGKANLGLSVNGEELSAAIDCLRNAATGQKCDRNVERSLNVVVDYLKKLVQMIVEKYREHWANDRAMGICTCKDISEHVPWLYSKHVQKLEARETVIICELQGNFDQLIRTLKELVHKNLPECCKNINRTEAILLNYEIRGIKTMSYVANSETLTMKYKAEKATVNTITCHAENILNGLEQQRDDIEIEMLHSVDDATFTEDFSSESPEDLYRTETDQISYPKSKNKRRDIEAKLNTIANGFHLINSTMAICDDDDEKIEPKIYGISDLTPSTKGNYATATPRHCSEISEYIPNRLKSQIASLQCTKNFQHLLGGEIRICSKEKRINYIISAGVNFNAVELGLDVNNQPLAVKRIQKESWVGKIIKTLVEPLLGLVDSHILHYLACKYEGDELILVTPLCKWNMAQYVQVIRQSHATIMPALTAMQIIKQLLTGLAVLHKCEVPIVHGNLKPSNIFIDFNGMVKIAEFGIHKALYKIIEAPKTSLMWFAKETLDIYQNSSIVECTLMSDIQVSGMVLYFVLTCGKHPFGDDIDDILNNIQRGVTKLNIRNQELKDLLLWMMLNNHEKRPVIDQVLSHTVFWSSVKKWRFVLCCAGVTQNGYPIPLNVDKLHRSMDTLSVDKTDWHNTIRSKLPHAVINENNTTVGLLKFIKNCYDQQPEISDIQWSCLILTSFPSLPMTLHRTLQNTNWLKHGVFLPFSIGSSLF